MPVRPRGQFAFPVRPIMRDQMKLLYKEGQDAYCGKRSVDDGDQDDCGPEEK